MLLLAQLAKESLKVIKIEAFLRMSFGSDDERRTGLRLVDCMESIAAANVFDYWNQS